MYSHIYIPGHPLEAFEWTQETFDLAKPSEINDMEERTRTRTSGLVDAPQKRIIKPKKEGDLPKPMISFRLEAIDGTAMNAVAFSETCEKYGHLLGANTPIMLCGSVRADKNGGKSFSINEIYPLQEVPALFSKRVTLHVRAGNWKEARVKEVQAVLKRHPGSIPLQLCLHYEDKSKVYVQCGEAWDVKPSEAFMKEIKPLVDVVKILVNPAPSLEDPEPRRRRGGWGEG